FERSNIGGAVGARQNVEDLIKFAKEAKGTGQSTLLHNQALRHELVERFVEAGVATMMSFKIVSIQANEGVAPGHEASVAKLYGTELNQRIQRTGMHVLGMYGQLDAKTDGPQPPLKGRIKYMYLRSIANTIEGGTSEIQRNIIATRGLGLPRAESSPRNNERPLQLWGGRCVTRGDAPTLFGAGGSPWPYRRTFRKRNCCAGSKGAGRSCRTCSAYLRPPSGRSRSGMAGR